MHIHGNLGAVSGILGSVSIACWVVVFSPQIMENFRRGSAEGLSVVFLVIWLAGDVFNILGAVLQGVLPTMIILALYYTLADMVLLGQIFYYEGFSLQDKVTKPPTRGRHDEEQVPTETTGLLRGESSAVTNGAGSTAESRRGSTLERFLSTVSSTVDPTHLSPATPLVPDPKPNDPPRRPHPPRTTMKDIIFNFIIVILVCAAGVFGWWLGELRSSSSPTKPPPSEPLEFNALGQVFGYICAFLYLGSRIPQLLLNYRRKSTEGISMLFFLFACIGNITYALSILAYDPQCAKGPKHCRPGEAAALYGRYFWVNFSWLLGSVGSLLLDMGVFIQYFMYLSDEEDGSEEDEDEQTAVGEEEEEGVVVSRRAGGRREVVRYEET